MKRNCGLLLLSFMLLSGCSFMPTTSGSLTDPSTSLNEPPSSTNEPSSSKDDSSNKPVDDVYGLTYADLYDINNVITFDIDISSSELHKIQDDWFNYSGNKSPIYRRADNVTITILKDQKEYVYNFDNVGVRMKGNTSRRDFINDKDELYANIHLKLSFEETFDDPLYYKPEEMMTWTKEEKLARESRTFFDMSKIDLRFNKNMDKSWIREYYALEMFRDFGIMTQHSNFSKVIINQDGNKKVNYGVYLMTEALDKSFIKHALDSNEQYINMASWDEEKKGTVGVEASKYGQLYKASWGINVYNPGTGADMSNVNDELFGVEPDDASYTPIYDLKTNKKSPDHSLIKAAFLALKNGSEAEIGELIDLEYFAMYEALATIAGNPDDLRNNYNNYALYFRRTDGKMIIIPIDEDRVFGISKDWDPSGNAMSLVGPFENNAVGSGNSQHNYLYTKTILNSISKTNQLYRQNLKDILASKWMQEDHFNAIHNIVRTKYEAFSNISFTNFPWTIGGEYDSTNENMPFKTYVEKKSQTIINDLNGGGGNEDNPDKPEEKDNPLSQYSDFYLRYTGNWGLKDDTNRFVKVAEDKYQFAHEIVTKDLREFECKVYIPYENGELWLRSDLNGGVLKKGENMVFNFAKEDVGASLVFTLIPSTGRLSWEIVHNIVL